MFASDIERRVLGHLPAWVEHEDTYQQAELDAGASHSIRSYAIGELTSRLSEDRSTPTRTEDRVAVFLEALAEKGFAAETDGQWRMTEAGFDALAQPMLADHEQTSGPVQIGTGG